MNKVRRNAIEKGFDIPENKSVLKKKLEINFSQLADFGIFPVVGEVENAAGF